ncbi:YcgN family cysteine cluster protein, partial [Hydrogenovibrio sp. SC-1]
PLPEWHPLISGKSTSVQAANIGLLAIPVVVDQDGLDYEDYVIESL